MIKRLIFDLDNTLIEWKEDYIFALENVLRQLNVSYTKEQLRSYDDAIVSYEKYHDRYYVRDFVNYVNDTCCSKLPLEFVSLLIKEQGKCFSKDQELVDTIRYLYTKYDLVVLSNWFTETQKLRLEGVGILPYFSVISGGDEHSLKPNLEAFSSVLEGILPGECMMIGDSLKHDIIPALQLGMNAIWITNKNSDEYLTAPNVYTLKKIL